MVDLQGMIDDNPDSFYKYGVEACNKAYLYEFSNRMAESNAAYTLAAEAFKTAIELGHVEAKSYLGILYEHGTGVEQSDEEAVKWYRKAAEEGSSDGMTHLGFMYSRGKSVEQSFDKALKLYKKAAEMGSDDRIGKPLKRLNQ